MKFQGFCESNQHWYMISIIMTIYGLKWVTKPAFTRSACNFFNPTLAKGNDTYLQQLFENPQKLNRYNSHIEQFRLCT